MNILNFASAALLQLPKCILLRFHVFLKRTNDIDTCKLTDFIMTLFFRVVIQGTCRMCYSNLKYTFSYWNFIKFLRIDEIMLQSDQFDDTRLDKTGRKFSRVTLIINRWSAMFVLLAENRFPLVQSFNYWIKF